MSYTTIPVKDGARPFELETGKPFVLHRLLMNCHECGKVFSPLMALLIATDKCDYYLNTYCRLHKYTLLGKSANAVCEHLPVHGHIWIYDPKDNMQGRIVKTNENVEPTEINK